MFDINGDKRFALMPSGDYRARQYMGELLAQQDTAYMRLQGNGLNAEAVQAQCDTVLASLDTNTLYRFIIDEWDRCDVNHLAASLTYLDDELPPMVRIILISRTIPTILWHDPYWQAKTHLVLSDAQMLTHDAVPSLQKPDIHVRGFGQGEVWVNGRNITAWRGDVIKSLFFLLVDRQYTTNAMIYKGLWPDKTSEQAKNNFQVAKNALNRVIGMKFIQYDRKQGVYTLRNDINWQYDVRQFEATLTQANRVCHDTITYERLLRQVLYYGKHPYLNDMDGLWIQDRRRQLQQQQADIYLALTHLLEQRQDYQTALTHCLKAYRQHNDTKTLTHCVRLMEKLGLSDRAAEMRSGVYN